MKITKVNHADLQEEDSIVKLESGLYPEVTFSGIMIAFGFTIFQRTTYSDNNKYVFL